MHSPSAELNRQGNERFSRGDYTQAYVCYAQALECDRVSGDRRSLVATLGNLGNICAVSGRRDQAHTYYQEVLELQKILGDERGSERHWPILAIFVPMPASGIGPRRITWKRWI
jgi:Tetratricopeptide repeat.